MSSQCSHIVEGKLRKTFVRYEALLSHLVFPSDDARTRTKMSKSICEECGLGDRPVPLMSRVLMMCCIECPIFRCLQHILPHLRDAKHAFALSMESGHIYCLKCGDFVYDRALEGMRVEALTKYRSRFNLSVPPSWNPTDEDLKRLAVCYSTDDGPAVRGLINLGNTCFMNCILQSLLHSPALRDYFLADQHKCSSNTCVFCELNKILQFFYSGASRETYCPSMILQLVWMRSHMSGYRQHDAHEFFVTVIEMAHMDSRTPFSTRTVSPDCKCIIDQLFTGHLQSDLRCSSCSHLSTKVDPFWDVSLNLSPGIRDLSLEKCLEGYVRAEILEHGTACTNCNGICPNKQLSFLKTPFIFVFHLKRFEHDTHLRKKITTKVTFPEVLDMAPYTTPFRNNPELFDCRSNGSAALINRRRCEYHLFAVVQHEGTLDSGHYTSFVLSRDKWYLCDDDKVRPVSHERALAAEGYILFYQIANTRFK